MKKTLLIKAVLASTLFASQVVYATTISVVTPTNQDTTVTGDIDITPTGQVVVNVGEAITVNTSNTSVSLDANNININAILTNGPGGTNGINIVNGKTGQSATVDVGVNTGIKANTDGILIDNIAATVDSYGNIIGGNSAINITSNGQTATITNESTGVMTGNAMPTILVQAGGTGLTLSNSGLIQNTLAGAQDTIQTHDSFTLITNDGSGTIKAQGGAANAINISGAVAITGDITNLGTITTSSTGNAIFLNNDLTGSIVNAIGGIIQTTSTGNALNLAGDFTSVANSGVIEATALGGTAINVTKNIAGTISNTGYVRAVDQSAILLGGDITQLINGSGGIITSNSANAVIFAGPGPITIPGGTLNQGIFNNGIIQNFAVGNNAIDLQTNSANSNVTQAGGTIIGNILLAPFDGKAVAGFQDAFDMTGGQITGNVVAADMAGNQNILTLTAGIITGNVTLGNQGDIVNLAGTTINGTGMLNGGTGADIFNLSSGSFMQLNGGGGADTLNVLANTTLLGTVDAIGTINVSSNVNLNVDAPITNMDGGTLTLNGGSGLVASANITGTSNILNNGVLSIQNGVTIDVSPLGAVLNNGDLSILTNGLLKAGSYHQTAGSGFEVEIQNPGNFGKIEVGLGGATLDANSFIRPFTTGQFIPAGTQFDIIKAPLGGINDLSIVDPFSVVLVFDKSPQLGVTCNAGANDCVRLTAQRIPYSVLSSTILGQEVGNVLDLLAQQPIGKINPDLLNLLGQLDLSTSVGELDSELISLAPVVNGALVMQSRASMNAAFKSVERRLEDLRHLKPLGEEHYRVKRSGINYGEYDEEEEFDYEADVPQASLWLKALGGVLDQRTRNQVEGYLGYIGGVAMGGDWGIPGLATVGFAVSRANTNSVGNTSDENVIDEVGNQFVFYGWFNPIEPIFVDAMIGFSTHTYDTRRNIGIGNISTSSFAHFFGLQYGAQVDIGYGFKCDTLIVSPIARVKYTLLEVDEYTESGAGGLSLSVSSESNNELILGAGLRVLGKMDYAQALYCPEASAMFFYDFYADREELVADFLGLGNVGFPVTGIKPTHTGLLLGVGVTAHYHDHYTFTTKYSLELRDHFFGHLGYIQLAYMWD